MLIQNLDRETLAPAYGGALCQGVQPWAGVTEPPFFTTWVILAPGQTARAHKHQEHEAFVITRGRGRMRVDDETTEVVAGDVVFMKPWSTHELTNVDEGDELHFLDLCWEKMDEAVAVNDEVLAAGRAAAGSTLVTATSPGALRAARVHARYLEQRGGQAAAVEASHDGVDELVRRLLDRGAAAASGSGYVLPLGEVRDVLSARLAAASMAARPRAVCERVLASGEGEVACTRRELERAAACLAAAEGHDAGRWTVFCDADDVRACGILLPALALAVRPEGPLPAALVAVEPGADPAGSGDTASWDGWLDDVYRRVAEGFDGKVPSTGAWTDGQQRFFQAVVRLGREAAEAYETASFSLRHARRVLDELIARARGFASDEGHWQDVPGRFEEWRTTIALEALAAKTLACLAAPLLPEDAARRWRELGFGGEPGWEEVPVFVPGGQQISAPRGASPRD